MHYRHSFHAGNFADVLKHTLLCGLLRALNRKDKPWCFVDTHAGAGLYDLTGEGASRTGEWQDGIGRLHAARDVPEPLVTYLRIVGELQAQPVDSASIATQQLYPGSPLIARSLARSGDRLLLCERVAEVGAELRTVLAGDARVHIHRRDGYEAQSLLPPPEKRGLVLIDPPFERADEFDAAADFFVAALSRFGNGSYAVWYPLKNRHNAARFVRRVVREAKRPAVDFGFDTGAPGEGQMRACGVLVVNPPFQFADEMQPALRIIERELAQGPRAEVRTESFAAA